MNTSLIDILEEFLKLNASRDASFIAIKSLAEGLLIGYKSTIGMKDAFETGCDKLEELKTNFLDELRKSLPELPDLFAQENTQDLVHLLEKLNIRDYLFESTLKSQIERSQKLEKIERLLNLSADYTEIPTFSKAHLLIIEPKSSKIASTLSSEHYTLYEASTAQKAASFLKKNPIDILLIHHTCLEMLTGEIRDYCLNFTSNIMIIVIGKGDDFSLINHCFSLGVDDFIALPLHETILHHRIDALFEKSQLNRLNLKKTRDFKDSMEELSRIIEDIEDVFILLNDQNRIISYNKRIFNIFPHLERDYNPGSSESLVGENFITLIQKNFKRHIYDDLLQKNSKTHLKNLEEKLAEPSCEWQENLCQGAALSYRLQATIDGNKILLIKDQNATNLGRHHLAYLAYFDSLTGTMNRQFFMQRLEQMMSDQNNRIPLVLFMIDLDGFKEVNDTYGHEMGDWVLQQLAHRLKASVRQGDIVARFGGDEFTIVLKNIASEETVRDIATRMIETITNVYVRGNIKISIGASIGISRYPLESTTPKDLVGHADTAMYSVKQHGKNNFRFYHELVLPKNSIVH